MRKIKFDREEFTELFNSGMKHSELAEHFKCNPCTITRIHKELGLPPFKGTPKRVSQQLLEQISTYLDDGWSFAEIIRTTGVDYSTLRRHFPGRQWTLQQTTEFHISIRRIKEGPRKKKGQRNVLQVQG